MKDYVDVNKLNRRLKQVIGQITAIQRMLDEDAPGDDILLQINAAKAALHSCAKIVLEGHLKHCVQEGIDHGNVTKAVTDFNTAVESFANIK